MTHGAEIWERILRGETRGGVEGAVGAAARGMLAALAGGYGVAVAAYRAAYDWRWIRPRGLPCPVLSVGNLTVGGTGKTTTTRWLAWRLMAGGVRPAILSRGYRSAAGRTPMVVSDPGGIRLATDRSGDEPQLLARSLPGVPVLIGRDRVASGRLACGEFGVGACLLDDGFQYWRLRKDVEIVLIDATCAFGYGALIPRGLLRESPRALRRADLVILTRVDFVEPVVHVAIEREVRRWAPAVRWAGARHRPQDLVALDGSARAPLAALSEGRWAALSSIARPDSFERTLAASGAVRLVPFRFPDHHRYSEGEIGAVVRRARAAGCTAVVTTEKDAVKLAARWFAGMACWVLPIDLEFVWGEDEIERLLEERVGVGSRATAAAYQTR